MLIDIISVILAIVIFLGGAMVIAGLMIFIGNHAMMPGNVSEIEQLRHDAQNVNVIQSEDVIGQVVEINRKIAREQRMNRTWWAGWAIPNQWEEIELIALPE